MVEALDTILDRDIPRNHIEEHFGEQLKVLRDVVNYGTKLIPRCLESSQKAVPGFVLLGVLLKQAVRSKYLSEWRPSILSIKSVTYTVENNFAPRAPSS